MNFSKNKNVIVKEMEKVEKAVEPNQENKRSKISYTI